VGIIQRQSIKNALVNFSGTAIGVLSILYIFPLDYEIYGYAQWLYSTAYLLIPIFGLGLPHFMVKFFPFFEARGLGENALPFLLCCIFVVFLVFLIPSIVFSGSIFYLWGLLGFDIELIKANYGFLIALAGLLILSQSMLIFSSALKRIVIPDLVNNVGYKIVLPILVLLYYFDLLNKSTLATWILIFFFLVSSFLLIYIRSLRSFSWNPAAAAFSIAEYKEFGKYLLFSSLNSLGTVLVFRLDVIMIGAMVGLEASGIYSLLLVMAGVMDIPSKAIGNIAGPIISSSWQQNNMANIDSIYKKSSLHLTIAGLIIFLLIWMNLPSLIQVLPGKNLGGEVVWVFVFLGLAKLVDHITSVNTQIIIYSNYYRINLYALLVLAGVNFVLNYFLIDDLGILGAAIATFVSLTLFNTVKYLYIARKFDLHALSSNLMRIVGFGCVLATGIFFLPSIGNPWVDMVWQSILLVCIFTLGILRLQPSEEIQALYLQVKDKIFSFRN